MKTNPTIEIILNHELPADFLSDIEKSLQKSEIGVIKSYTEKEEYYNFTGQEIVDALIAIKDSSASIFLYPALYEGLKAAVTGIWNKLRTAKKQDNSQRKITIQFEDEQGRIVNVKLEGDIDQKTADSAVSKIAEAIAKRTEYLNKEEFHKQDEENTVVDLYYNASTDCWEPYNYAEARKKMEELMRKAEEDFNG